jgi:hypothetical protein
MGKEKLKKSALRKAGDSPKLEHLALVGKFTDGKCRQVLINPKTQDVILSAILAFEGTITVLETTIDGLDIEFPS